MSEDYAYGREEIVYVTEESSSAYGTLVQPSAGDAMKVLKSDMNFKQERKDRPEKGSSRSIISRFTGRKTADWSVEKYILPSGVKGTKPDDALLWESMFGSEEVHSAQSVDYLLLAEPSMSLSIFREAGHFREAVSGAVPSKWSLKFGGGDEPKVTFSGEAKDHYLISSDVLTADATGTTVIEVTDARQYCTGMIIKVGTEDNSSAGFLINSIDYTLNKLTLNAQVTSQATGAAVIPLPITPTTTGDVIPVIIGSFKLNNGTVYITECGFDIDNKVKLRNDEFATSSARGYRHTEFREVTSNFTLYFEKGAAKWANDAKRFTAQDIEVNLGDTDGCKLEIDANQVEFEIPNIEVPDNDECTLPITGKCLGSAGEDEIKVVFL